MIKNRFDFFLGGHDLEMIEISRLLKEREQSVSDLELSWGAALSDYGSSIEASVSIGRVPVAVELADDMPVDWPTRRYIHFIDHHGPHSGEGVPTSLQQVCSLIGAPSEAKTRWRRLVSANDRGYIAGLQEAGATLEEVRRVRAADRAAQGVSSADEAKAWTAIASRTIVGQLTLVEAGIPSATAVSDLIHSALGGPGAGRLLVLLPEKFAAYGDGAMILSLAETTRSSWWGGSLPHHGFWGAYRRDAPALHEVVDLIQRTP